MIRELIRNYIILPVLFTIVWGGMIVAAIVTKMRDEDRARKFGF